MATAFVGVRAGRPAMLKRCRTCGEVKQVSEDAMVSEFSLNNRSTSKRAATFRAHCKVCVRTDVDLREKRRAASAKWYKNKKQSDPAYFAEYARMAYHLRREKAGLPVGVRPVKASALMPDDCQPRLPVRPLVTLIARLAAEEGASEAAVCERLGIPVRRLWGWRSGESAAAGFDAAERVLTFAGVRPEELWPAAEYPEVAERLGYLGERAA